MVNKEAKLYASSHSGNITSIYNAFIAGIKSDSAKDNAVKFVLWCFNTNWSLKADGEGRFIDVETGEKKTIEQIYQLFKNETKAGTGLSSLDITMSEDILMKRLFKQFLATELSNDVASTLISKGYSTNEELLEYLSSSGKTLPIKSAIDYVNKFLDLYSRRLPSKYNINDLCSIVYPDLLVKKGRVIGVSFTESKVKYDLEVEMTINNPPGNSQDFTTIYNVDSAYLIDFKEDITETKQGHHTIN